MSSKSFGMGHCDREIYKQQWCKFWPNPFTTGRTKLSFSVKINFHHQITYEIYPDPSMVLVNVTITGKKWRNAHIDKEQPCKNVFYTQENKVYPHVTILLDLIFDIRSRFKTYLINLFWVTCKWFSKQRYFHQRRAPFKECKALIKPLKFW